MKQGRSQTRRLLRHILCHEGPNQFPAPLSHRRVVGVARSPSIPLPEAMFGSIKSPAFEDITKAHTIKLVSAFRGPRQSTQLNQGRKYIGEMDRRRAFTWGKAACPTHHERNAYPAFVHFVF